MVMFRSEIGAVIPDEAVSQDPLFGGMQLSRQFKFLGTGESANKQGLLVEYQNC